MANEIIHWHHDVRNIRSSVGTNAPKSLYKSEIPILSQVLPRRRSFARSLSHPRTLVSDLGFTRRHVFHAKFYVKLDDEAFCCALLSTSIAVAGCILAIDTLDRQILEVNLPKSDLFPARCRLYSPENLNSFSVICILYVIPSFICS